MKQFMFEWFALVTAPSSTSFMHQQKWPYNFTYRTYSINQKAWPLGRYVLFLPCYMDGGGWQRKRSSRYLIVLWSGWHILELMPQRVIASGASWRVCRILSPVLWMEKRAELSACLKNHSTADSKVKINYGNKLLRVAFVCQNRY